MHVDRRRLAPWVAAFVASWLALSACGQTPTAGGSAQPAKPGSPTGAAPASGPADWNTVVAAAKREGRVSLVGPVGDALGNVLVNPFQKEYGITVDLLALPGNAESVGSS